MSGVNVKERWAELRSRTVETREATLSRVPLLGRLVTDFPRVEVIDRSMVIGAQGLLALVPMLIVMAAFLPADLTDFVTVRIGEVTGLDRAEANLLDAGGGAAVDVTRVRTQTGIIGITITILSATSFARAIQRAYTTVWELPRVGGVKAWRRCLVWLLGWLLTLEALSTLARMDDRRAWLEEVTLLTQVVVATCTWWVSIRFLLFSRVGWGACFPAALITGGVMIAYSNMSTLVMPRFAAKSAEQFGILGLVLTLATWLVGFAFVVVMSALLGRTLAEDEATRALAARVRSWLSARRGSRKP